MMGSALPVQQSAGWFVQEIASTLVLSGIGVHLMERWSILAEDALDELLVELNMDSATATVATATSRQLPEGAAASGDGALEVYGGEVTADKWADSPVGRRVVGISLPRVLAPGEPHVFELSFTRPLPPRPLRHVYTSLVPCQQLDLRVRFGPDFMPSAVSRVEGAMLTGVPLPGMDGPSLPWHVPVEPTGDVQARFHHIVPGRLYGLAWG